MEPQGHRRRGAGRREFLAVGSRAVRHRLQRYWRSSTCCRSLIVMRSPYFFACNTRVSNDSQIASSFSMAAVSTDAGSNRFDRRRRLR